MDHYFAFPDHSKSRLHSLFFFNSSNFFKDFILLKIFYLFIFMEKGREGEREEEKHQCVVASRVL